MLRHMATASGWVISSRTTHLQGHLGVEAHVREAQHRCNHHCQITLVLGPEPQVDLRAVMCKHSGVSQDTLMDEAMFADAYETPATHSPCVLCTKALLCAGTACVHGAPATCRWPAGSSPLCQGSLGKGMGLQCRQSYVCASLDAPQPRRTSVPPRSAMDTGISSQPAGTLNS